MTNGATQKRCVYCFHYDAEKDTCGEDFCNYVRVNSTGKRSPFRRSPNQVDRDLLGNRIED
jgi:hypothetical protein